MRGAEADYFELFRNDDDGEIPNPHHACICLNRTGYPLSYHRATAPHTHKSTQKYFWCFTSLCAPGGSPRVRPMLRRKFSTWADEEQRRAAKRETDRQTDSRRERGRVGVWARLHLHLQLFSRAFDTFKYSSDFTSFVHRVHKTNKERGGRGAHAKVFFFCGTQRE